MNSRSMRRMVLPALALGLIAVTMAWAFQGSTAKAQPAPPNITWVASATSVAVGSNFVLTISGDTGTTPVDTYGVLVSLPAGVRFVSGAHQNGATFPSAFPEPVPGPGPGDFSTGAGHGAPDATFVGDIEKWTISCDAAGAKVLHLKSLVEDPNGTSWYDALGAVNTALSPDITVTCQAASNIVVTKSDGPPADPVAAGTTFPYTIKATNMGPANAIGLVVGDTLPDIADADGRGMKILDDPYQPFVMIPGVLASTSTATASRMSRACPASPGSSGPTRTRSRRPTSLTAPSPARGLWRRRTASPSSTTWPRIRA